MMADADPSYVTLCLDAHGIYRGAGNSAVAMFDVLTLYGSRVTELHLRQSKDNIWTEAMCDGDIDYTALAKYLLRIGVRPHLVMEQAVKISSPKTMSTIEAFRKSSQYPGMFLPLLHRIGHCSTNLKSVSCRMNESFVSVFDDSDFFHSNKTFGDIFINEWH